MAASGRYTGAMHVVKNTVRRGEREYTSVLLRRSFRVDGKVRKETLANLSHLPEEAVELLRGVLRGEHYLPAGGAFTIERSLPHGHVSAALVMARRLGLAELLAREASPERDRCLAMIIARVLVPASKLATTRLLQTSTLAEELSLGDVGEDDLYAALDWLAERQPAIEERLARRHLADGELVLYDVSSSYFEGHTCPLAKRGYSRDGKRGTLQITYGLLCDRAGRPVAVEVFSGETHDAATLASQIEKLKTRFKLASLVVVSDRGFVTKANLQLLRDTDGARWITALKAPQIKKLVRDGSLQLSLFDETNLAEISDLADYPGERLVVCRNPLVGAERTRKRVDLLDATRRDLDALKARVDAGTLIGTTQIALAVGATKNRYKMAKHLAIEITDTTLTYTTLTSKITDEAALDGLYILRTNIEPDALPTRDVVRSYKQLEQVERAFRTLKGPDLAIRPIHHHLSHRVRSHVFLCTLAYYLTWHLREAWTPLIFKDEHHPTATDPVAKAVRSDHATQKARTKTTTTGETCHSYRTLLAELATQTRNTIRLANTTTTFTQLSEPTPTQTDALHLAQTAPIT